mgnify:CR=1 FL=1
MPLYEIDNFSFWDRNDTPPLQDEIDKDIATCACGQTYFREVEIFQVLAGHTVIVGQRAPKKRDPFFLYECVACKRLMEPNLLHNQRNYLSKPYDEFRASMATKPDEIQIRKSG